MKVAFCLFGLSYVDESVHVVTSEDCKKLNGNTFEIMVKSYEQYKKHVFDVNQDVDIDVYFHTRNNSKIEIIKDMYKPKAYLVDNVDDISQLNNVNSFHPEKINKAFISRHDSVKKVLNLIEGQYDFIFLCRFDLYFLKPLDFSKIDLNVNQIMVAQNDHWKVNNEAFKGFGNELHSNAVKLNKHEVIPATVLNLVDSWFLFRQEAVNAMIQVSEVHSNILLKHSYYSNPDINIHIFMAKYFVERLGYELKQWENHFYTCFTRYFMPSGISYF